MAGDTRGLFKNIQWHLTYNVEMPLDNSSSLWHRGRRSSGVDSQSAC